MWKNAQARAANGDLRVPPVLSERDLQNAALNDPYSFLGTYAQARASGSSMDAVRAERLARARLETTTGTVVPLSGIDAAIEFNPVVRGLVGFGVGLAEIVDTPRAFIEGIDNLAIDAYGFSKQAVFGSEDSTYAARSGLVRLFQNEGVGKGTVDLIGGTVKSLPVISMLSSGNDPYELGRAGAGTLFALGASTSLSGIRVGSTVEAATGRPMRSAADLNFYRDEDLSLRTDWTPDPKNRQTAYGNSVRHWYDHEAEFPELGSYNDYVDATHSFLKEPPPGTESFVRPNGDVMRYHAPTNTFGVLRADGQPRTMFRPEIPNYWELQLKKYGVVK